MIKKTCCETFRNKVLSNICSICAINLHKAIHWKNLVTIILQYLLAILHNYKYDNRNLLSMYQSKISPGA